MRVHLPLSYSAVAAGTNSATAPERITPWPVAVRSDLRRVATGMPRPAPPRWTRAMYEGSQSVPERPKRAAKDKKEGKGQKAAGGGDRGPDEAVDPRIDNIFLNAIRYLLQAFAMALAFANRREKLRRLAHHGLYLSCTTRPRGLDRDPFVNDETSCRAPEPANPRNSRANLSTRLHKLQQNPLGMLDGWPKSVPRDLRLGLGLR